MNKKILLPLLISLYVLPIEASANCPLPETIVYQCHDWNGHKMCTWGPLGGWYDGNADDSPSLKNGDHLAPNAFQKALWYPYPDESKPFGATNCFYIGPEGERVKLRQHTGYGSVPAPKGKHWTHSTEEGFPSTTLECTVGTSACRFEFGERT